MVEIERKGFKDKHGDKVTLKPKVANATENNFASFDSEGHLKDSNSKPSDFAPATGSTAYAPVNHTHPGYAASTHNHPIDNITGLPEALYALSARVAALEAQAEGSSQGSGVTDNPNSDSDIESGQGNTQGPGQQGDAEEGGGLADIVTP